MHVLSSLRLRCRSLSALTLVLVLAACHGADNFPSLAQRPAELAFAQGAPAAPPPGTGTADAATLRQIAALRADAAHAHESFSRRAEEAEHLAAAVRGTAVGSEAWAAATTAQGALDSARNDMALVLANLDALRARTAVAAADSNTASGQATYVAVADADSAVAGLMADEEARIASLHKVLGN